MPNTAAKVGGRMLKDAARVMHGLVRVALAAVAAAHAPQHQAEGLFEDVVDVHALIAACWFIERGQQNFPISTVFITPKRLPRTILKLRRKISACRSKHVIVKRGSGFGDG